MKTMPDFDAVWNRIKEHQRVEFITKKEKRFSYEISDEKLQVLPPYEPFNNPKSNFEKSLPHVPCDGPASLKACVGSKNIGPSYVWAILHDKRIRRDDW